MEWSGFPLLQVPERHACGPAIRGILREYPTTSIRNHTAKLVGYNIWDDLLLTVGGSGYSLNKMEHEVLRKLGEPRIHFAIVCASISCPRLLNDIQGCIMPSAANTTRAKSSGYFATVPSQEILPIVNSRFESSVKGIYVIGDVGGLPLVKMAANHYSGGASSSTTIWNSKSCRRK